jgi:glycosyltransferase involved in cell wall biosynthesis
MKILLVTFWYLPHVGGVNTYLQVLKEELEKRGHQVDLLAHHPNMNEVYLLTQDRSVNKKPILFPLYDMMIDYFEQEMPHLDDWARFREIESYVFELSALLLGLDDYDIIHTQDVISTRAISRVKPVSMPHVATIHGLLMEEFLVTGELEREENIRWQYSYMEEHLGASVADFTILPSEWLRREYLNRFNIVNPDKLTVIPYGLHTDKIIEETDAMERIPRDDGKLIIICPARIVPYKGQRYLIEALAKLRHVRGDFLCQFAGDGPQRKELEDLVKEYQLHPNVEFLGNREDIYYLYKQADIFVLPTLVENHSLAVMESQLIGLPVITTRVGGNIELLTDMHTGILVEPRDSDGLFEAILKLMNDVALRERLSVNSRHWARKYWHPDNMVGRTLAVYQKAIQQSK